jgi:hypothetical protein
MNHDVKYWLGLFGVVTIVAVVATMAIRSGPSVSKVRTGNVAGTITVGGRPLARGTITFHWNFGHSVTAPVTNGKYSADRLPVTICSIELDGTGVPIKYTSRQESGIKYQVTEGDNTVDVQIP